jgi:tetratricopeptide (TPR) repeat protein
MLRLSFCLFLILLSSFAALTQDRKPVQRKDSVTVTGDISKQQLALEDQLNAVLSEADQSLKTGKTDDAVKRYELALALVHNEPLLVEQEGRVLRKVGNGYIQANRPADAIAIFQKLVESMKKECDPETTLASTCGAAQQDLGVAKMRAGDLEGALASLRQAESNYLKAEKRSDSHEFTMLQIMLQAKAKVLMAVALFQLGKTAEAVTTTEGAIPELRRVKEDKSITIGIRNSAANAIEDAQTVLSRLKSAQ